MGGGVGRDEGGQADDIKRPIVILFDFHNNCERGRHYYHNIDEDVPARPCRGPARRGRPRGRSP